MTVRNPTFLGGASGQGGSFVDVTLPTGLVPGNFLIGIMTTSQAAGPAPDGWNTLDVQVSSRVIYRTVPPEGIPAKVTCQFPGYTGYGDAISVSIVAYSAAPTLGKWTFAHPGDNGPGIGPPTSPAPGLVVALFGCGNTVFGPLATDAPLTTRATTDGSTRWALTCVGDALVTSGDQWRPSSSSISGYAWAVWAITFTSGGAPPCRLYPREDGRGTSSGPRAYPRPRGQQTGFRQSDYY